MKKLKPLICVCLLSSMLMAAQALSPGISRLITFYGVPESAVSLSITLPYLISIPFTLLAGRLTERFPLKGLLMTGAAIICVTGLLPCIITNFTAILIVRACMGVGLGLLFTLTPSMAPEYYPEGQLRSLTIGMQSAWAGSGGFVFNILSGYLVQEKTQNIYFVYFLCVLFTVLVWFLLPAKPLAGRKEEKKERSSFAASSLFTAFITFLFLSAGMTLSLSVSVFLEEQGLGTAIEAGYATSAYSAAAFIFGCLYVAVSRILKEKAILTACLVSAAGMLLCVLGGNIVLVYAGAAMIGAGLSLFMPSCVNRIIRTTPAGAATMSIAVMMVGSSVGQTFSGAFINPAASLFGQQAFIRFYVSAAIFILTALLSLVPVRRTR